MNAWSPVHNRSDQITKATPTQCHSYTKINMDTGHVEDGEASGAIAWFLLCLVNTCLEGSMYHNDATPTVALELDTSIDTPCQTLIGGSVEHFHFTQHMC